MGLAEPIYKTDIANRLVVAKEWGKERDELGVWD